MQTTVVKQAYRYALDPTPRQARALSSHCGAARFAYNWGLALVKERIDAHHAGVGIDVPWTLPSLRRAWNREKETVAPWWRQNSKEAYSSGLWQLAQALRAWSDSRAGRSGGASIGFPSPKRRSGRASCRFTTGTIRIDGRSRVRLPRIGAVRTHEPTTKLAARISSGRARLLAATIVREGDRWHVSFTVENQRDPTTPIRPNETVGVDLGIRKLATLSDGTHIENPRASEKSLRRVRALSRRLRRQRPGSRRRELTRRRLARAHQRAANVRRDRANKLTTMLASTYGVVVIEDLNVRAMVKNRCLARVLSDAGLGAVRRQLEYKADWYGSQLVVADRFFASSKLCSSCGYRLASLPLSEREFHCVRCGLRLDRDLNAARNLELVAPSGGETPNARGVPVRPPVGGTGRGNANPAAEAASDRDRRSATGGRAVLDEQAAPNDGNARGGTALGSVPNVRGAGRRAG